MIKGQSPTKEMLEKSKKSKLENLVSKYKWDLIEPFLNNQIENGIRSRKKSFLTLKEFKEKTLDGKSIEDMKKENINKHILQFYSNFCQGKITLSKEKFESEYLLGKSIDQIAKENNISREDITFLRQLYNFKTKGAKYQNRKKTESSLTQYQKDVLYGTMMGDAKRQSSCSCSSASFKHGVTHLHKEFYKHLKFLIILLYL